MRSIPRTAKNLVIHLSKTNKDKVGVIIEAKRPSNRGEMMSADKPNTKALHELILYYLDERNKANNNEVKQLVITNVYEWLSRRGWMLWLFRQAGEANSKNTNYQFWQQENHPIELFSNKFLDQKLNYIHNNPVSAGLVDNPWEYRYSSAPDYMNNQKGLLEIELV